jgi:hypothetical protein
VTHGVGFNQICHVGLIEHSDSCNHTVIGDSDSTDVVISLCSNLSRTSSSVRIEPVIRVSRIGVWIIATEVIACFGILRVSISFNAMCNLVSTVFVRN